MACEHRQRQLGGQNHRRDTFAHGELLPDSMQVLVPPVVDRQRVADAGLGVVTSCLVQSLALAATPHPRCRQACRGRGWEPD
eukprot:2255663-Rhodomonas_salina.3